MPSRSNKQARYMAMMAHNPEKAKKGDVPQAVAKKFNDADAESGRLSEAMKDKNRGS